MPKRYRESALDPYLIAAVCAVLSLMLFYRAAKGLITGVAPGLHHAALAGPVHTLQDDPSIFWFSIVLHLGFAFFTARYAWRTFRQ
ncbi:hypothetical protein [Alkalimonas amylolytica]|uniref:Uncharacterized protein n=1 Tax=Alkalimonas amylolytica TaxID=152573 RepID=A0A1H3XT48_ALKAM|nr:hypothetical protein [Alkalimonas amylolytica]SEA02599.1 hypothetical protein SAMN04488051_101385 [Alkalimonas amylolytica]